MRRSTPLLILLTGFSLFAGGAQAATKKAIWGPVTLPDGSSAFPTYRDLGVRFLQRSLNWAAIAADAPADPREPADPAYRWPEELDRAVAEARRYGVRLALAAAGSPRWANGDRGPAWVPNKYAYADFLTAAARRYPSVDHWMIWGETNRAEVFRPLPPNSRYGPRRYARLLAAAYRALKRQSRGNVVIGGMTFTFGAVWPRDFVRWARLPNGKPPPLDWWGHNPFGTRFPNLSKPEWRGYEGSRDFSDLDLLHSDLRRAYLGEYSRFRRQPPPIWLSEFTIPAERATYEFPWWTTLQGQAQWLTAAYRIARRTPWIAGLGWTRVLRPGGRAFASSPDAQRWVWDDYTHRRPFTRKSFRHLFEDCGFQVERLGYESAARITGIVSGWTRRKRRPRVLVLGARLPKVRRNVWILARRR